MQVQCFWPAGHGVKLPPAHELATGGVSGYRGSVQPQLHLTACAAQSWELRGAACTPLPRSISSLDSGLGAENLHRGKFHAVRGEDASHGTTGVHCVDADLVDFLEQIFLHFLYAIRAISKFEKFNKYSLAIVSQGGGSQLRPLHWKLTVRTTVLLENCVSKHYNKIFACAMYFCIYNNPKNYYPYCMHEER